jgi:hypothetical protein
MSRPKSINPARGYGGRIYRINYSRIILFLLSVKPPADVIETNDIIIAAGIKSVLKEMGWI